jgi:glyoxylase-like metal-dependent hydrolase (beta-lactamase superfamily II)
LRHQIVQRGTLEITAKAGMLDNRPTCSLLEFNDLINDEKKYILIDLDHPAKSHTDLINSLRVLGITPQQINLVILTHLHPDHIGHKDLFSHALFLFHKDEKLAFYFKKNRTLKLEEDVIYDPKENTCSQYTDGPPDFKNLEDKIYIRHSPGHTKGSLVIFISIDKLVHAFAGDIFLNKEYYDNWEPPGMSWNQQRIYEHMSFIKEHADIIIPGHGAPFRI